jgi:tRNA nucleotidyltransferase/poly(A) polymerase
MAAHRIDTDALFATHPFALELLRRLGEAGHEAVLIGGVVRDGLAAAMGRDVLYPPNDVDIATSARPDQVRTLFADRQIVGVGEEFGVLVVVGPGGKNYEVATFRTEEEYDGRWPRKVELVRDLEGDVRRRDLTVNGLAATADGRVIDHVGGLDDLEARRIRAIGEPGARFREDYLRMLRAVRFACQIDGVIDGETAAAIRDSAARLGEISKERIRDELLHLLATPRAAQGISLLDELDLLEQILPELLLGKEIPQPEDYHPEGDVFVHTLHAVAVADRFVTDPIVKLAVLLHDVGKPQALRRSGGANMGGHCAIGARICHGIGERLRLSREELARLTFLVKNHMRVAALPEMGRGKQVRFVSWGERRDGVGLRERFPRFFELLQVLIADSEASAHRSSGWAPVLREMLRVAEHIDRVCDMDRAREIIDGHVLIDLGVPAGPKLGRLLADLHDRVLAGEITTREEAVEEAKAAILEGREGKNGSV